MGLVPILKKKTKALSVRRQQEGSHLHIRKAFYQNLTWSQASQPPDLWEINVHHLSCLVNGLYFGSSTKILCIMVWLWWGQVNTLPFSLRQTALPHMRMSLEKWGGFCACRSPKGTYSSPVLPQVFLVITEWRPMGKRLLNENRFFLCLRFLEILDFSSRPHLSFKSMLTL